MRRVLRPYSRHACLIAGRDQNDCVDVIRHDHEFVDRGRPAIATYRQQRKFHGSPYRRVIKYDRAFMGANGDEVCSRTPVVERWEAYRTPVMSSRTESHGNARLAEHAAERQGANGTRGLGWGQGRYGSCCATQNRSRELRRRRTECRPTRGRNLRRTSGRFSSASET